MQLGMLQKNFSLRRVVFKLGMCGHVTPRDDPVFSWRWRQPGGWSWCELMLEVRTQGNTFCLEPSQSSLCRSSASWPSSARHCVPTPSPFLREAPPLAQPPWCFSAHTLEPISPVRGGARGAVSAAWPQHLARLPPRRAKASDAGETRARSAGQRRGFLSKCLRLGFLLTEGRLQQLAADIPSGGSQSTPSWHPVREPGAALTAVRQHSQGSRGPAWRAIKGIPLGREEAVNRPRNAGAQACPRQTARACLTHTAPSALTDPLLHAPSPWPPAHFLCVPAGGSTALLPSAPGGLGTGPKHPGDSPPCLWPQVPKEFNFTENQLPLHKWKLESANIFSAFHVYFPTF